MAATTPQTRLIVVLGPPGSGKGTLCKRLQVTLGMQHVSTSRLAYDVSQKYPDMFAGHDDTTKVSQGVAVPDLLIVDAIADRCRPRPGSAPRPPPAAILLDGFPVTRQQAVRLCAGLDVERCVVLDVPDDVCVERLTGRRIDPSNGNIYHSRFYPPPDDLDKSRLVRRDYDANPEAARRKLTEYHMQFGFVVPCFRKIDVVDADKPVDQVLAYLTTLLSHAPEPRPDTSTSTALSTPVEEAPANATVSPKCVVCLAENADFLVVPCGHQCGCRTCLTSIKNSSTPLCPICRGEMAMLVQVFPSGVLDDDDGAVRL
ncbi:adenylate kinase, mitochondrial [Pelomyxa schiedti]|nr:adenylate kinase, mitochondrial [Pelomyxa schiedti]